MSTALTQVSGRLKVSEEELTSIVMNTVMPNGGLRYYLAVLMGCVIVFVASIKDA